MSKLPILLLASAVCLIGTWVHAQKINVHVVCHTHDDVGWLKTVDQYYYGANNSIQHAGVQYVLDSVVLSLSQNPARKFIYVEQAFFQRWWRQQDDATKEQVKKFVANGQFEFVNGGWCMHDEAATHYIAMIDQTTTGHRFIKEQFGKVPTIGWQIDPFGHSSTQASLLSAEVGFNALFFGRIDYADHDLRMKENRMEFIWRASPSLGQRAQVFTGAFQNGNYGPPDGFCFDLFCSDDPVQDDERLEDYNLNRLVDLWVKRAQEYKSHTRDWDIMFTMGSDFMYENANEWYKNLDKIINAVNKDGRVNAFYSTPSAYVAAKQKASIAWEVKTDDFFPYADCPNCYWTGYFVSRPALKRMVYDTSAYLQAARQLEVYHGKTGDATLELELSQGIAQHHDAVSGTSKQHVAFDYAKRLSIGQAKAEAMVNEVLSLGAGGVSQCRLLNISLCAATSGAANFRVSVYNPVAHPRTEFIALPVSTNRLVVYGADGRTPVPFQILNQALSAKRPEAPAFQVVFPAQSQATGGGVYYVKPSAQEAPTYTPVRSVDPHAPLVTIENALIALEFNNGYLTLDITQRWFWYRSFVQDREQNSGAYIFRPNGTTAYPVSDAAPTMEVVTGPLVQEVRQIIAPWVTQTTRVRAGEPFAEFEFTVGPIPFEDGVGREVITRYSSSIRSASKFYTDSNGREMIERIRDFRSTWKLNNTQPVASNYYPMNAAAFIRDTNAQLTILNDRAQGVASLQDGALEVMVHRRTLHDDGRGVGEPINETDSIMPYPTPIRIGKGLVITAKHYLLLDKPPIAAKTWRPLQQRVFAPHLAVFSAATEETDNKIFPAEKWASIHNGALPENVELITLQVLKTPPKSALVRLAHSFAVGEDPTLSRAANVSLQSIFPNPIASVVELSLTANQRRSEMPPMHPWKVQNEPAPKEPTMRSLAPAVGDDFTVIVNPMEVRTYQVTFN